MISFFILIPKGRYETWMHHTGIRAKRCYRDATVTSKLLRCEGPPMSIEKELDPEHYRDNPIAIAKYLTEIIKKNDLAILVRAIGNVMRAQNVKALSEETGLRRENLYRMFAGHRDPTLGNTMKILASFGVQLAVKPRASIKIRPPRPKLGRPRSKAVD